MTARRQLAVPRVLRPNGHIIGALLAGLVLAIGAVVALHWIVLFIANLGRGFDASDESMYLLSAEYPHVASASSTGFDSYLSVLWRLSGGSIQCFRLAGLLLLLAAVAVAAVIALTPAASSRGWSRLIVAAMAFNLASITLTTYSLWKPTPGYNLLVLVVALLVAGITARLALDDHAYSEVPGEQRTLRPSMVSLGFALSVGLFTKAPAFIVVGALSGGLILATRGHKWLSVRWKQLMAGLGGGVLVFLVLTGLPIGVARRFIHGLHATQILRAHTIQTTLETTTMREVYGPWFLRFLLGAAALWLLWRYVKADWARLTLTATGSLATAFVFVRSLPYGGSSNSSLGDGWWWIRFAAMMLLWSTATSRVISRKLLVGPMVSLMAVGAASGSGNGIFREVAFTAGVLGLGLLVHGIVLTALRSDTCEPTTVRPSLRTVASLLPIAVFLFVGSLASNHILLGAIHTPDRLGGALHEQDVGVDLGSLGKLEVSAETARYIHELRVIGERIPDDARDCLVDLAGGTPLSAIALRMKPAALPWIIGGYPGSNAFADYVLRDANCLSGGFVLIESPGGKRAIDRPGWLDTRKVVLLGRVRYHGYLDEFQMVWLVSAEPVVGKG